MAVERFIRLARPMTGEEELEEVRGVLESGWLSQGPKLTEFEGMVAERVGTEHGFATTSGTTALHLSLVVLDIGPDDEVLVPDYTFPATANVVLQQGATPVLVDIEPDTFTMDAGDLAEKITPRSRAIIPVHAFGLSADMDPIMELANMHQLAVVEDAACALGATYKGRPCGGLGTMGCFSFHPRKVITTGEGGLIATNDGALADRIRLLRNHGGIRKDGRFTFEAAGYNYRMSDIQAAVGVAQMRKLDSLIAHKRELAALMTANLNDMKGATAGSEPGWGGHIYQSYVVLLDEGIDRDRVIHDMRDEGIETTLGTYALHAQSAYADASGYAPGDLPNSYAAFRRSLTLPLYPPMDESDLDRVAQGLRNAIRDQVG